MVNLIKLVNGSFNTSPNIVQSVFNSVPVEIRFVMSATVGVLHVLAGATFLHGSLESDQVVISSALLGIGLLYVK